MWRKPGTLDVRTLCIWVVDDKFGILRLNIDGSTVFEVAA